MCDLFGSAPKIKLPPPAADPIEEGEVDVQSGVQQRKKKRRDAGIDAPTFLLPDQDLSL